MQQNLNEFDISRQGTLQTVEFKNVEPNRLSFIHCTISCDFAISANVSGLIVGQQASIILSDLASLCQIKIN